MPGEWTAERRARAAETAQREASRAQARQIRGLWIELEALERQGVSLQRVTEKYLR